MTVTSSQLTVTTEMNSNEIARDRKRLIDAAEHGRLEDIFDLSNKFSNDVKLLSEALIRSCVEGHLDAVKWLGGHTAADVNYNNREELWMWGFTPLTTACSRDHVDIVKYLVITCHADVNLLNSLGNTSLTGACRNVSMSVSMFLLSEVNDLDVNIANSDGNTAINLVVWCSKDYTQLHKASGRGDVTEVARLVYERGHKINVQDNAGDTPLHDACSNGHSEIVEMLMLAGADELITNDRGETPAQVAERGGHSELLKLLDRDNLWHIIKWRKMKLKLSFIVLMMLIMRLMRGKGSCQENGVIY